MATNSLVISGRKVKQGKRLEEGCSRRQAEGYFRSWSEGRNSV